jgi:hypothetical protein
MNDLGIAAVSLTTPIRPLILQMLELEAVQEEEQEVDDATADGRVRLSHSELAMIV